MFFRTLNKDVSVRDSIQDVLIGFYKRFYTERRDHFNRSWSGMWQFVLRIFNRHSVIIASLKNEMHIMPSQLADFDRLVREHEVTREEVVEYRDAIKSQKEEFVGRSGYLIIFIALIALVPKETVMMVDDLFGSVLRVIFYAALGLYVIVALLERDGINKRVSTSEQLCIVIDRWLENNPKEALATDPKEESD